MKADRGGWRPLRREELRDELVHDSYKSKRKLSEPTYCPECNAVYHSGRWQWGAVATGAHQTLCPACRRTHDKFPAGYVTLKGEFVATHRTRSCNSSATVKHTRRQSMRLNASCPSRM